MPVLFQFLLRISRSFVILAPWPMSRDCWGPFHSCTSKPPTDQIGRSSDICDSLLSKQLCCKLKAGIRVTALLTELCSALINAHCALCGSHPHRCDVPSAAQILQSLQSWCTLAGGKVYNLPRVWAHYMGTVLYRNESQLARMRRRAL